MSEATDKIARIYEELAAAIERGAVTPDATELSAMSLLLDHFGLRGLAYRFAELAAKASKNQN